MRTVLVDYRLLDVGQDIHYIEYAVVELTHIWDQFLTIARHQAGSQVVETWLKAVSLHSWDPATQTVIIKTPNAFVHDWVKSNYATLIQTHLCRLLNVDVIKLIFVDDTKNRDKPVSEIDLVPTPAQQVPSRHRSSTSIAPQSTASKSGGVINSNYQFDTFVVGPNNSLACAAAQAVTDRPGTMYNPLFIYGGSGLGKTHLLHAIGNGIKETSPDIVVLYQSADRFVNEFISSIRFDKIHKFHAKYRRVDLLLIDDIQFIANKDQTQEAFFHIFNTLHEARKQIVFTSDTYPQDIPGLAERLRSRLAWGLVADIQAPTLETKIEILKKKAQLSGQQLPDDVVHFLAARVVSNIRELEGSLIRVLAFASLTRQPVTLTLARRVLIRPNEQQEDTPSVVRPALDGIAERVCKHFAYTLDDLRSNSRTKEIVQARQVAMYLMKKMTDKALSEIGTFLHRKDHSTVIHAVGKVKDQMDQDPQFCAVVKKIEQQLLR